MSAAAIRTGDHVFHEPSGETWLVAYAENGKVCCCGWPESWADESDCKVVYRASDDERHKLLLEMAGMNGHDSRKSYALRALGEGKERRAGDD